MKIKLLGLVISFLFMQSILAINIDKYTKSMIKSPGFLTYYWDKSSGKTYLEVDAINHDFLYVNSLASGVGSNDIGLDRGQLGDKRIVRFVRTGPKLFLQQPNLDYRAYSNNQLEVSAVKEAFASSILWGFEIVAESKSHQLIDITDFLLRDSHNIKGRLSQQNQGNYSADKSRSSVYLPRTKNFPNNTEFESTITLVGTKPGNNIRSVTPTAEIVTVRTHHSFIKLPDNKYKPREFDPRTGQFSITYKDYAVPLGSSMTKRMLARHRLEKKDPSKKLSEVIKPIIYYLDPGVPEPVRSALKEGASWWAEAFEAAGFKNAFRVEILPADADPMDVRYNTIQWVHRSTRGWSYGDTIIDPRTGEILKGHVTLGSLRVRQDMLIAQGLTSPFIEGNEAAEELKEMALARLRQLSAHEVGHTLGLTHNFAASKKDRASVMDYPHPLIQLDAKGNISLENAYGKGLAEWDMLSIEYSYRQFSEQSETQGLARIIQKIADSGIEFITDQDSRASSMAHPSASLWDNGSDPVEELTRVLKIRKLALKQFGEHSIKNGEPWSSLEQVFVPLYLFHRYQSDAAAKFIGGVNYSYAIRGGYLPSKQTEVEPDAQAKALKALIQTMSSKELAIPKSILSAIIPPAYGYGRNRESFKTKTRPTFDAFSAVESAATYTLKLLLDPKRSVRLIQQKALNQKNLGVDDVQKAIIDSSWKRVLKDPYLAEVQRSINWAVLKQFFELAASTDSSPQVRAITLSTIRKLKTWLGNKNRGKPGQKAMYQQAVKDITQFLESGSTNELPKTNALPPGSPIG